ncbi:hypothetical protein H5410_006280 [Solanum commersonii]|uniref:Phosphatidic acid phosphatase type 2/haloperoxidase domain-containing protein n=1 Tax=Solanum commersonii TaxID=4109 RepID=A0A9J6A8R1_SOLCO|nr:hypothetical protein H5410_006280 [Solanum commersonii]
MADLLRNGDAEDVAVKLGAFELQALIHDFSTSARFNATLNSLSKWLVAAVFVIIFLWRHDTEAHWAASGSILNARLSIVLKRILNQERPVSAIRSDPGMPSTHAQSIFYTVMFCIVSSNILSQSDEENMLGLDNYPSLCICLRVNFH